MRVPVTCTLVWSDLNLGLPRPDRARTEFSGPALIFGNDIGWVISTLESRAAVKAIWKFPNTHFTAAREFMEPFHFKPFLLSCKIYVTSHHTFIANWDTLKGQTFLFIVDAKAESIITTHNCDLLSAYHTGTCLEWALQIHPVSIWRWDDFMCSMPSLFYLLCLPLPHDAVNSTRAGLLRSLLLRSAVSRLYVIGTQVHLEWN